MSSKATVYPAGSKQGRVKLPAIILLVEADLLLQSSEAEQQISQALAAGLTAVLLTGGSGAGTGRSPAACYRLSSTARL